MPKFEDVFHTDFARSMSTMEKEMEQHMQEMQRHFKEKFEQFEKPMPKMKKEENNQQPIDAGKAKSNLTNIESSN